MEFSNVDRYLSNELINAANVDWCLRRIEGVASSRLQAQLTARYNEDVPVRAFNFIFVFILFPPLSLTILGA